MKVYEPKDIRNLTFLGHAGSGKTTMAEALLFKSGFVNRRGTVEDNNTVSDYSEIEHEKTCSIFATPVFAEWNNTKLNIIDTPGYDDYIGETVAAIRVADLGVIFINTSNGIEVGAELGFHHAYKQGKPIMFVVNKLDNEQAKFDQNIEDLKTAFGGSVTIAQLPVKTGQGFDTVVDLLTMAAYKFSPEGKPEKIDIPGEVADQAEELRNELIESIAESDEELMNKYLEEGELSQADLDKGLKTAIITRQIFPVFASCGKNAAGVETLLDFFVNAAPSPLDMPAPKAGETEVACDPSAKTATFVFKSYSEPSLGMMTYFRVYSGKIAAGQDLVNENKNATERLGQLFYMNGKKRIEVPEVMAGDIAATVKLKSTHINDTLHEKGLNVEFGEIEYPNPKVRVAVEPKTKGEEEKVGMGLHSLHLEDPSLVVEHSKELRQMILYAQGEQHLSVAKWRLENRFKVETIFVDPKVPYRETIQKQVRGSYRHKKQSGGAGQFAEVHMMIEPWYEGMPDPEGLSVRGKDLHKLDWGGNLEYVNCIVGGVIDQRFMPAILKGVMEKMEIGPLTGSYVRDIRVTIYDGKMHPVDSNEAAFKMAGRMVFKDSFVKAGPKILEPIYEVEIRCPEEFVGDVMSDLPTRRGVIQGIEADGKTQVIKARMPLAELDKYATALRSMTQARATHTQAFAEYQAVPPNVQQDLMDAYKKEQEEE
ncbi:MAG: elongation factor G [Candidatus Kapaibacterium sp.]